MQILCKRHNKKGSQFLETLCCSVWEHTGSNRGPSACKADALNQLSYAPAFGSANIRSRNLNKKVIFEKVFFYEILDIDTTSALQAGAVSISF